MDLRNLQDGEAEAIRDAFYEHSVLVFHGQSLSPRELVRFGEAFGDPEPHVALKYRHPEVPEVSDITNVKPDGSVDPMGTTRAQSWHTDGSFMKKSSALAILHSLEAVSSGGETLFSSTRAAHDALSEGMRQSLVGLRAIHSYAAGPASKGSNVPLAKEQEGLYPPVEHPIVRTHPHTGRKALFINPQHLAASSGCPRKRRWMCSISCSSTRRRKSSATSTHGAPVTSSCGIRRRRCIAGRVDFRPTNDGS